MIYLTRLNGTPIVVNAELIEMVEATPDTIITTTTGKKIIVKEKLEEVVQKVKEYKQKLLEGKK